MASTPSKAAWVGGWPDFLITSLRASEKLTMSSVWGVAQSLSCVLAGPAAGRHADLQWSHFTASFFTLVSPLTGQAFFCGRRLSFT